MKSIFITEKNDFQEPNSRMKDRNSFAVRDLIKEFSKEAYLSIDIYNNLMMQNIKKILKKWKDEKVKLCRLVVVLIKKLKECQEDEIRKLLAEKVTKVDFVKRNGLEKTLTQEING